jgi:hypothetical protein
MGAIGSWKKLSGLNKAILKRNVVFPINIMNKGKTESRCHIREMMH